MLGDDCHLLFLTLHCVLGGHHAFVEQREEQQAGAGPDLPPVLPPLPPLGAALPRVPVATAVSVHPSGYPPSNTKTPAVSSERGAHTDPTHQTAALFRQSLPCHVLLLGSLLSSLPQQPLHRGLRQFLFRAISFQRLLRDDLKQCGRHSSLFRERFTWR